MLVSSFIVHKLGREAYLDRQLFGHETVAIIFVLQPKTFTPKFWFPV